ncbi:MAG: hypothetical protein ACOYJB_04365 [Christensenellaceae bacterium]|jgi:hypothetical protein
MEAIVQYLKNNVIGKMLYTEELRYSLDDGTLEGRYSDKMSFCNLRASDFVLTFDMFIAADEKVFFNTGHKKGELAKDHSAISLFRYELARRKSTGKPTGFFRMVSATGKSASAEGVVSSIYDVRLEGNILCLTEDQALYRDQTNGKGSYKPAAFHADQRFYLENEKLHFSYKGESFDVDPNNFMRSASADSFPAFIAVEK